MATKKKPAGYSGTPLPKKLGIREESVLALLGAPTGFLELLVPMPDAVAVRTAARGRCDVVVLFATERKVLEKKLPVAVRALIESGGGLWLAWPKQASGMPTDLSDGVVRELGLATGLVDNKVCAIDATWSGLRFVRRRKTK